MGSSTSKDASSSQYVFSSDTPVSLSESFVNSLQKSPESDAIRAKVTEHHIQSRVTSELNNLRSSSLDKLSTASESTSKDPVGPSTSGKAASSPKGYSFTEKPLFSRIYDLIAGTKSDSGSHDADSSLTSHVVSRDIDDLRQKLASRRRLVEADKDIARAREGVVTCLRLNDRRPLDCWQEVDKFKAEVGRLEKRFVDDNGG